MNVYTLIAATIVLEAALFLDAAFGQQIAHVVNAVLP